MTLQAGTGSLADGEGDVEAGSAAGGGEDPKASGLVTVTTHAAANRKKRIVWGLLKRMCV
ncbi:hypothetical protein [Aquabacterium fontiphilum]|jgi:hypothetical protein|uniref:hypothetical protein n=1 Tax=Aquabacterium fontiphilum TaxID=450365 RepID=UPI00191C0C7D|nr:hypothetical protein [Aquabacterium fontiphilum]